MSCKLEAHRWLGLLYWDVGALRDADAHLRQAGELGSLDPMPYRVLGLIRSDLNDLEGALADYQEARRRDAARPGQMKPADRQAMLVELAGTQRQLGQPRDALETLQAAEETAESLTLAAECHDELGESSLAARCLKDALLLEPDYLRALITQAHHALNANDVPAAIVVLERALRKNPQEEAVHYLLSQAYHRTGDEERAERHATQRDELRELGSRFAELNHRVATEPKQPDTCYQLALTAERLGRREVAANWYQATLTLDPNHAGAQAHLLSLAEAGTTPDSSKPDGSTRGGGADVKAHD
jgi:tetratricopeptide (TPR) repeat protein